MYNLFHPKKDGRILEFFEANYDKVTLLCLPNFVGRLYKVEQELRQKNVKLKLPIKAFTTNNIEDLASKPGFKETGHVFIVADPDDETARLELLRERAPHLRFVGLANDLVPLLMARNVHVIFEEIFPEEKPMPDTATILFATPRSGSTLLADYLTETGLGDFKEHLRNDIITAWSGDYNFDKKAALQLFIKSSAKDGYFGTKIITHFFLRTLPSLRVSLRS